MEGSLRTLLRPTEDLKVALEASTDGPRNIEGDNGRIVAVVTHCTTTLHDDEELASLFILKPKVHTRPDQTRQGYVVEHALPILGPFSITASQQRRATVNTLPSTAPQSTTAFTLTITPAFPPDVASPRNSPTPDRYSSPAVPERLTLRTSDTERLRTLLAEVKNFTSRDASTMSLGLSASGAAETAAWAWLKPYLAHARRGPAELPLSYLRAPDLRTSGANAPSILERLSAAYAGQPGDEADDIEVVREDWIRQRTLANHLDVGEMKLNIRVGSFNVNGKLPGEETDISHWVHGTKAEADVADLLPPLEQLSPFHLPGLHAPTHIPSSTESNNPNTNEGSNSNVPADIVVLGFQELDLSTGALIYTTESTREEAWARAVLRALGPSYVKVASKQLVGMLLVVFAKVDVVGQIHVIRASAVGSGIMGVMGNKGGVALRFTFFPSAPWQSITPKLGSDDDTLRPLTLTFVNAHLAAFDEQLDRRNADFHDLSRRLAFSPDPNDKAAEGAESIFESDVLFWMGDLNYRIELPDDQVRALLADGEDTTIHPSTRPENFATLRHFDQLHTTIRTGKAFERFSEHPISHLPTYRFGSGPGIGTDTLGYDTKRRPAWTDRILHMRAAHLQLHQSNYAAHSGIGMSDHRPVSADFVVHAPVVRMSRYEEDMRKLYRNVAAIEEADERPKVHVQSSVMELGKVGYRREVVRTFSIRNSGKQPAVWRFVPVDENTPIHPPWLSFSPAAGLLLPEEDVHITLCVLVTEETASRFNLGPYRLEHTLILHVARGKDHFVALGADYVPTSFANEIEVLARLPGPIRTLQGRHELLPEDKAKNSPQVVMRLVSWLMDHAGDMEGLFVERGDNEIMETIREALDTGAAFPNQPDHPHALSIASTLLALLASLPTPLVPARLHPQLVQAQDRDGAYGALSEFPPAAINIWVSLGAFLHYHIRQRAGGNERLASQLADELVAIFTPVLMRSVHGEELHPAQVVTPLEKRMFMRWFVTD